MSSRVMMVDYSCCFRNQLVSLCVVAYFAGCESFFYRMFLLLADSGLEKGSHGLWMGSRINPTIRPHLCI